MATPTHTPSSRPFSRHVQGTCTAQVRVVVRVRPFLPSEFEFEGKRSVSCISVIDGGSEPLPGQEISVHIKDQLSSRKECYKLDAFFGQGDDLAQIFHREVSPLIPGTFKGLNATVFAYGATGSGKTYTMQGTDEQPGLIPLAMRDILSMRENSGSLVEVAYYEIYMERCYDLLEPKAKEIVVMEDKEGQVQMKGLSRVPVRSMSEFFEVFATGVHRRKTAHTGLNDVSSRSHGVLSIFISDGTTTGKLNLIDLAGNEDNRRTGNEGVRLLESAKINQSLFALSNVIYALNNNGPRVPYRESKLTRVLQDSLGGASRALMIACLNPVSYQEAVHTVSLAARSRHITNYVGLDTKQDTPKVKVDMEAKLRMWLESRGKTKSIQRIDGLFSPPIASKTPSSASIKRPDSVTRSIQRIDGLFSPFVSKNPNSVASVKRPDSARSSAKAMIKDYGIPNRRKLFDSKFPAKPHQETHLSSILSEAAEPMQEGEQSFAKRGNISERDSAKEEYLCMSGHNDGHGDCRETSQDAPSHGGDVKKESARNVTNGNSPSLLTHLLPESYAIEEYTNIKNGQAEALHMVGESLSELQIINERVLSPVPQNVQSDKITRLFEPTTPKTPYEGAETPLQKFNALSCKLKDSLIQEYLEFLNTASKEELLALKGIGQKRAEYILQLREGSPQPLKTLNDLEMIGLSSKQVHNMFRGTARGIF